METAMTPQQKRVLTFVGVALAIGFGFGLYAAWQWIIPFMDTVVFPGMAHLERTLGRSAGLAVFLVVLIAIWGAVIAMWVRYLRAVRARSRQPQRH